MGEYGVLAKYLLKNVLLFKKGFAKYHLCIMIVKAGNFHITYMSYRTQRSMKMA